MFRVRKMNVETTHSDLLVDIPRNRSVEKLREYIKTQWNIPPDDQRLYYQGKELIDKHILIEYKIQRNHIVHLFIRPKITESSSEFSSESKQKQPDANESDKENWITGESQYYKVGDPIDFKIDDDSWNGAWFEGEIVQILRNPDVPQSEKEENLRFICNVPRYDYMKPFTGNFENIRPRSHYIFDFAELKEGTKALASVNVDKPMQRGYWYDVEIRKILKKKVEAIAFMGHVSLECTLHFVNELMRIEEPMLLDERKGDLPNPALRKYPADCTSCLDDKKRNCKKCGCHTCGKKDRPELLLLCDECDMGFHITCLNPPLESLPDEEHWYCAECKNDDTEIVRAGESLKTGSKRSKMPALKENPTTRDWDNGMACAGRSKECTIVPKNHFGPVPGVDVGTLWKYRAQVSEAGIHRPLVAGIHGRSDEGAYSIVVSGGYEDDVDNGEEFEYTGAGGRDLSGNKRVNDQTCDQKLEQTNKALALCCKAKFNDVTGATAENWKAGKPVRVVRKHGKSKYAPADGYRYDGIYKVVKYYPEKGKSGFIVWKYLLRRDDPNPAPWIEKIPTFEMIYPPEYTAYEAMKQQRKAEKAQANKKSPKKAKNKKEQKSPQTGDKRKQTSILDYQGTPKKAKIENKYTLSKECSQWVDEDVENRKLWDDCLAKLSEGKVKFLEIVMETFVCICCQELLHAPVTLPCKHNVCEDCLKRSFKAGICVCPTCRADLGKDYNMVVNNILRKILQELFPGYDRDR